MDAKTEKLKALMNEAGMSQRDLASTLGISESAVSRMLDGTTNRDLTLTEAEAFLAEVRKRTGKKRGLSLRDLLTPISAGGAA